MSRSSQYTYYSGPTIFFYCSGFSHQNYDRLAKIYSIRRRMQTRRKPKSGREVCHVCHRFFFVRHLNARTADQAKMARGRWRGCEKNYTLGTIHRNAASQSDEEKRTKRPHSLDGKRYFSNLFTFFHSHIPPTQFEKIFFFLLLDTGLAHIFQAITKNNRRNSHAQWNSNNQPIIKFDQFVLPTYQPSSAHTF